jgi:hypothetical protein
MNAKASAKILPGLLLGVTLAGPAFAQSATQSIEGCREFSKMR